MKVLAISSSVEIIDDTNMIKDKAETTEFNRTHHRGHREGYLAAYRVRSSSSVRGGAAGCFGRKGFGGGGEPPFSSRER
jgi:hypothetical protein